MQFLSGKELSKAITKITSKSEAKVRCAVAFWGTGADARFTPDADHEIRLICNLKAGGTNPFALEKLVPRFVVQQHDSLHAKVYLNNQAAIVASANASANGLGLEGNEQALWLEAGVFIDDPKMVAEIACWFETTWKASRPIDKVDIERAKIAWRARQAAKPSLNSFASFETDAPNFPLINWYMDLAWEVNPELTQDRTQDYVKALTQRIEDGIDIEGDEDREVLVPGTWVLIFRRTQEGLPHAQVALSWVNIGAILNDGFRYDGEQEWSAVALAAEQRGQEPFSVTDRHFRAAFQDLISQDKFEQLRTYDYEGAWFTDDRLALTRQFWSDLQTSPGWTRAEAGRDRR